MNFDKGTVLGESIADTILETLKHSNIGVNVQSLPDTDLEVLIQTIDTKSELDIGLLLTGIDEEYPQNSSLDKVRITEDTNDAIKWRNDQDTSYSWNDQSLPDKIVVLSRGGQPPRINSLEKLENIPSAAIRNQVAEVLGKKDDFSGNRPVKEFTKAFQTKFGNNFGLESWAKYTASILNEKGQDSISAIEKNLYIIGLIPDDGLLNNPSEVRSRLEDNNRKVNRIANLSKSAKAVE